MPVIITPTRVQKAQTTSGNSTSGTVTFGAGVGIGNLVYVLIAISSQNTATSSTSGLTKAAEEISNATANITLALWGGIVGHGGPAQGATAFTLTWTGSHSFVIYAEEWRAPYGWLPSVLDVAKHTFGATTGTAFDSGATAITTQGAEFLIAAHGYRGATQTLSNITPGWTNQANIANSTNSSIAPYVQTVQAQTTAQVKASVGSAVGWAGVVATYKLATPPYQVATPSGLIFPVGIATSVTTHTRTITPVTAALKSLGIARTVPATAALKSLGITRTVPATTALKSLGITRTVPATIALKSLGLARTIPATAALKSLGVARTVSATIALKSLGIKRTIPATIALKSLGLTRTITPVTVALTSRLTRTVPATAALKSLGISRTIPVTVALKSLGVARTVPATITLKSLGLTRTIGPNTVALSNRITRTVPSTTALKSLGLARIIPATVALALVAIPPGIATIGDSLVNVATIGDHAVSIATIGDTSLAVATIGDAEL